MGGLFEREKKKGTSEKHSKFNKQEIEQMLSQIKAQVLQLKRSVRIVDANITDADRSIKEISRASEAIAEGANNQAADTGIALELIRDLQVQIADLYNLSLELSEKADTARRSSETGRDNVEVLRSSEQKAIGIVDGFGKKVLELDDMVSKIDTILSAINQITMQTNLLSLNAAIEAARAGEVGRGFAVVAGEIRQLANESRKSSEEIGAIVAEITGKLSEVRSAADMIIEDMRHRDEIMRDVSATFDQMLSNLTELIEGEKESNSKINALNIFKDRIVEKISSVATVTQQSAAVTQEMTSQLMSQSNLQEVAIASVDTIKKISDSLDDELEKYGVAAAGGATHRLGISLLEKSEFMNDIETAAVQEADKMEVELVVRTPSEFNVDEQIRAVESMVEEGIAAIALFPSDPERLAPVIDRAADKGVNIITIDGDVPESKRLSNIGTDPFKMGVMAGEAAIKHLPDGGSIVVLLCAAGLATVKKRFEGFRQTIARKGSIRITEKVEMPGTDMQETEKQLQGLLGRNGSADLLYVVTDESSVVAAKLLKETGRKIKLVCIANSSEVMQYVRQGIVSSQLCMRNRLWGELLVRRLIEAAEGKKIPEFDDTGGYEINIGNVSVFLKQ